MAATAVAELPGGRRSPGLLRAAAGGLCAVLSLPNFRLPHSRSLSLSAAARRTTPAAGADSFFVKWMELGRWPRRLLRSYRVDVDRRGCCAQRLAGRITGVARCKPSLYARA